MTSKQAFNRITASIVVITFFVSNHFSFPLYAATATPAVSTAQAFPKEIKLLEVPKSIGKIEDAFQGSSNQSVIIIQDAHAIPDAQRSIEKIIEHFQKNYGVGLIGLEGANSILDPQIFKSFPDQELLKKVFADYMDQGELTGGTAAAIFSNLPATFHGVEDWNLYERGLGLYLAAMQEEGTLGEKLKNWKQDLEARKKQVYSKKLLEVDEKLSAFQEHNSDLLSILQFLASIKPPRQGTELAVVLEESRDKRDNFAAAEKLEVEVKRIAKQMAASLRGAPTGRRSNLQPEIATAPSGPRNDLEAFNQKQQQFHLSRISPQEFALFLNELIEKNGLSIQVSPELLGGMKNQQMIQNIEGTKFFDDFEEYAKSVKDSLIQNDEQRKIDQEADLLDLVQRLAKLELSREGWLELKAVNRESGIGDRDMNQDLKFHFAFYENAEQRDDALLSKLIKLMNEKTFQAATHDTRPTNHALLVAGGFHAHGLTQSLKAKNISYALVIPSINKIPAETPYQEQMKGNVSWKKYFEVENGKINIYQAFVRATRDRLLREAEFVKGETFDASRDTLHSSRLLKEWRDKIVRDLADKKEIETAGQYTRFIDETVKADPTWRPNKEFELGLQKINRFIDGLRGLKSQNRLTEENVMKLLQPSAIPSEVGLAIASRSELRLPADLAAAAVAEITKPEPAVRSEARDVIDSLEEDISKLEEGVKSVGVPNLPTLGFHGKANRPNNTYFYFVFKDRNWNNKDAEMKAEEFLERLQGTIISTANYSEFDWSKGLMPKIHLLINHDKFRVIGTNNKDPKGKLGMLDPRQKRIQQFRYFYREGVVNPNEVPTEAIHEITIAQDELEDIERKSLGLAEPNIGISQESVKINLGYRLLYKKALETILDLATRSEARGADAKKLLAHLRELQNDQTRLARTLKLMLATAKNDSNVLATSGFPDEMQNRIFDERGGLREDILTGFLANRDGMDLAIQAAGRSKDYSPIADDLRKTIPQAAVPAEQPTTAPETPRASTQDQAKRLVSHLSAIREDQTKLARTLKLILATADNDSKVLTTSGFTDDMNDRAFNPDGSLKPEVITNFLTNVDRMGSVISESKRSKDYDPIVTGLQTVLSAESTAERPNQETPRERTVPKTQAQNKPLEGMKEVLRQRVKNLEAMRQKIENEQMPDVLMFGDKHGKPEDLERVLKVARQAAKDGKRLDIVGHGDGFDRGMQNGRNWKIFQELIQIAKENPNVTVDLLFGNHDVWLIQAILLNDQNAMRGWRAQGGQEVIDELGMGKVKELAVWMLQNFKLFTIDERGFLHVHAGIPMDESGNPLINRERLDGLQNELTAIQHDVDANPQFLASPANRARLEKFFEDAHEVFWARQDAWLDKLMGDRVRIDQQNKEKLFEILTKLFKAQVGQTVPEPLIRKQVEQVWVQALMQKPEIFRQAGIQFEVLNGEPQVDKGKLDNFLAQLGVHGVVAGHIHLDKLLNLDNRIFIVDVDENDPGHLFFNGNGILFDAMTRSTKDLVASKTAVLAGIDEEIIRIKETLGEEVLQEQAQLQTHQALVKRDEPIIRERIAAKSSEEVSIDKDIMRRFKQAIQVGWGDGLFKFKARESTTIPGAVRVWDLKVAGQNIIALVNQDGTIIRGDQVGLLIQEGASLKVGRDRSAQGQQNYSFILDDKTYDLKLIQRGSVVDAVLVERGVPINVNAGNFDVSRTLVNELSRVAVTMEPGATSRTTISPVLMVRNAQEAEEVLAEMARSMAIDISAARAEVRASIEDYLNRYPQWKNLVDELSAQDSLGIAALREVFELGPLNFYRLIPNIAQHHELFTKLKSDDFLGIAALRKVFESSPGGFPDLLDTIAQHQDQFIQMFSELKSENFLGLATLRKAFESNPEEFSNALIRIARYHEPFTQIFSELKDSLGLAVLREDFKLSPRIFSDALRNIAQHHDQFIQKFNQLKSEGPLALANLREDFESDSWGFSNIGAEGTTARAEVRNEFNRPIAADGRAAEHAKVNLAIEEALRQKAQRQGKKEGELADPDFVNSDGEKFFFFEGVPGGGHAGVRSLNVFASNGAIAVHEVVEIRLWRALATEVLGMSDKEIDALKDGGIPGIMAKALKLDIPEAWLKDLKDQFHDEGVRAQKKAEAQGLGKIGVEQINAWKKENDAKAINDFKNRIEEVADIHFRPARFKEWLVNGKQLEADFKRQKILENLERGRQLAIPGKVAPLLALVADQFNAGNLEVARRIFNKVKNEKKMAGFEEAVRKGKEWKNFEAEFKHLPSAGQIVKDFQNRGQKVLMMHEVLSYILAEDKFVSAHIPVREGPSPADLNNFLDSLRNEFGAEMVNELVEENFQGADNVWEFLGRESWDQSDSEQETFILTFAFGVVLGLEERVDFSHERGVAMLRKLIAGNLKSPPAGVQKTFTIGGTTFQTTIDHLNMDWFDLDNPASGLPNNLDPVIAADGDGRASLEKNMAKFLQNLKGNKDFENKLAAVEDLLGRIIGIDVENMPLLLLIQKLDVGEIKDRIEALKEDLRNEGFIQNPDDWFQQKAAPEILALLLRMSPEFRRGLFNPMKENNKALLDHLKKFGNSKPLPAEIVNQARARVKKLIKEDKKSLLEAFFEDPNAKQGGLKVRLQIAQAFVDLLTIRLADDPGLFQQINPMEFMLEAMNAVELPVAQDEIRNSMMGAPIPLNHQFQVPRWMLFTFPTEDVLVSFSHEWGHRLFTAVAKPGNLGDPNLPDLETVHEVLARMEEPAFWQAHGRLTKDRIRQIEKEEKNNAARFPNHARADGKILELIHQVQQHNEVIEMGYGKADEQLLEIDWKAVITRARERVKEKGVQGFDLNNFAQREFEAVKNDANLPLFEKLPAPEFRGFAVQKPVQEAEQKRTVQRLFEVSDLRVEGEAARVLLQRIEEHPELGVFALTEEQLSQARAEVRIPIFEQGPDGELIPAHDVAGNILTKVESVPLGDNVFALKKDSLIPLGDIAIPDVPFGRLRMSMGGLADVVVVDADGIEKHLLVTNKRAMQQGKMKLAPFGGGIGGLDDVFIGFLNQELGIPMEAFEAVANRLKNTPNLEGMQPPRRRAVINQVFNELKENGELDLRLMIEGNDVRERAARLIQFFVKRQNREILPVRELVEELWQEQGLITREEAELWFGRFLTATEKQNLFGKGKNDEEPPSGGGDVLRGQPKPFPQTGGPSAMPIPSKEQEVGGRPRAGREAVRAEVRTKADLSFYYPMDWTAGGVAAQALRDLLRLNENEPDPVVMTNHNLNEPSSGEIIINFNGERVATDFLSGRHFLDALNDQLMDGYSHEYQERLTNQLDDPLKKLMTNMARAIGLVFVIAAVEFILGGAPLAVRFPWLLNPIGKAVILGILASFVFLGASLGIYQLSFWWRGLEWNRRKEAVKIIEQKIKEIKTTSRAETRAELRNDTAVYRDIPLSGDGLRKIVDHIRSKVPVGDVIQDLINEEDRQRGMMIFPASTIEINDPFGNEKKLYGLHNLLSGNSSKSATENFRTVLQGSVADEFFGQNTRFGQLGIQPTPDQLSVTLFETEINGKPSFRLRMYLNINQASMAIDNEALKDLPTIDGLNFIDALNQAKNVQYSRFWTASSVIVVKMADDSVWRLLWGSFPDRPSKIGITIQKVPQNEDQRSDSDIITVAQIDQNHPAYRPLGAAILSESQKAIKNIPISRWFASTAVHVSNSIEDRQFRIARVKAILKNSGVSDETADQMVPDEFQHAVITQTGIFPQMAAIISTQNGTKVLNVTRIRDDGTVQSIMVDHGFDNVEFTGFLKSENGNLRLIVVGKKKEEDAASPIADLSLFDVQNISQGTAKKIPLENENGERVDQIRVQGAINLNYRFWRIPTSLDAQTFFSVILQESPNFTTAFSTEDGSRVRAEVREKTQQDVDNKINELNKKYGFDTHPHLKNYIKGDFVANYFNRTKGFLPADVYQILEISDKIATLLHEQSKSNEESSYRIWYPRSFNFISGLMAQMPTFDLSRNEIESFINSLNAWQENLESDQEYKDAFIAFFTGSLFDDIGKAFPPQKTIGPEDMSKRILVYPGAGTDIDWVIDEDVKEIHLLDREGTNGKWESMLQEILNQLKARKDIKISGVRAPPISGAKLPKFLTASAIPYFSIPALATNQSFEIEVVVRNVGKKIVYQFGRNFLEMNFEQEFNQPLYLSYKGVGIFKRVADSEEAIVRFLSQLPVGTLIDGRFSTDFNFKGNSPNGIQVLGFMPITVAGRGKWPFYIKEKQLSKLELYRRRTSLMISENRNYLSIRSTNPEIKANIKEAYRTLRNAIDSVRAEVREGQPSFTDEEMSFFDPKNQNPSNNIILKNHFDEKYGKDYKVHLNIRRTHWKLGEPEESTRSYEVEIQVKDNDGKSTPLGFFHFHIVPGHELATLDFYPYAELDGNGITEFGNRKIPQLLIAWLAFGAARSGIPIRNTATRTAALVNLQLKYFGKEVRVGDLQGNWENIKDRFYAREIVGNLTLVDLKSKKEMKGVGLIKNLEKDTYKITAIGTSQFQIGQEVNVDEAGFVYLSEGDGQPIARVTHFEKAVTVGNRLATLAATTPPAAARAEVRNVQLVSVDDVGSAARAFTFQIINKELPKPEYSAVRAVVDDSLNALNQALAGPGEVDSKKAFQKLNDIFLLQKSNPLFYQYGTELLELRRLIAALDPEFFIQDSLKRIDELQDGKHDLSPVKTFFEELSQMPSQEKLEAVLKAFDPIYRELNANPQMQDLEFRILTLIPGFIVPWARLVNSVRQMRGNRITHITPERIDFLVKAGRIQQSPKAQSAAALFINQDFNALIREPILQGKFDEARENWDKTKPEQWVGEDSSGVVMKTAFKDAKLHLSGFLTMQPAAARIEAKEINAPVLVQAIVQGGAIPRAEIRNAINFVEIQGFSELQGALVKAYLEGKTQMPESTWYYTAVNAFMSTLDRYQSDKSEEKFAFGFVLPANDRDSVTRVLNDVLSKQSQEVGTVVTVGKIDRELQEKLSDLLIKLRTLPNLSKGVTLMEKQKNLPVGTLGQVSGTVNDVFVVLGIDGLDQVTNALARDAILVLQIVALIHAAAILRDDPDLLRRDKVAFKNELLKRLQISQNDLFQSSSTGFSISAKLVQEFLEQFKQAEAVKEAA